jgi:O-antigen/teichoic acid export membrane protein
MSNYLKILFDFLKINNFSSIASWIKKGFWAVLDQALFSGANFIVNILLARWLPPEEYGAFAVALSIYYLLLGFHTAVITEPMMVFGAGKYREQFRKYFGMVLWGHWGVSGFLFLGFSIIGFLLWHKGLINLFEAFIGLSIAFPFFTLQWISRRSAYVIFRPWQATVSSSIYCMIIIIILWILFQGGKLSVLTSILALGVSGLFSSLFILHLIKPHWKWWNYQGNPAPDIVVNDHWIYGRWAIGTVFLMWFPGNIAYILLPAWWGLEANAAVRALMNLVLPIQHAIAALGTLALPVLSSSFYNKKVNL